MKKLITLVIAVAMVMTLIPVMTFSTAAADVEGDWTVFRDPAKYEVDEGEAIKPDPGYQYNDEGFTTIAPDWTNYTPFFTVQTKEPQPLKDGVYLEVRIDEYAYGGEDESADHWISFNVSDEEGIEPGSIERGNNWLCLIRGEGDGSALMESYLTTKTTENRVGSFSGQGASHITIPVDDRGREIYTFEISWNGSAYVMKVNGMLVSNPTISSALQKWVENGDYYVGITLHSGVSNATQAITILKYGCNEADATIPVGYDSLEPEDNMLIFPPKTDASTVEANMPALLWDGTRKSTPTGTDVQLIPQGDNSYHVVSSGVSPYWWWHARNDITYSISDFPVFCMVMRNFWGEKGGIYYCAGNVLSANNNYKTDWTIFDEGCLLLQEGEDEYSIVVVDLTELLTEELIADDGRIHSVRPSFTMSPGDEWDVCFMGWFRSIEEAQNYSLNRLALTLPDNSETTADETNDSETNDSETNDPETNDPETSDSIVDTNSGEGTNNNATTEPITNSGCSSVVGFGVVAVLAAAVAVTKVLGAVYKIPLGNLLDKEGMAHFYVAYNIYSLLLILFHPIFQKNSLESALRKYLQTLTL